MRIIKDKMIKAQFEKYPDTKGPLTEWLKEAKRADWKSPQELKDRFPSASVLADNRFVFNIKGNHYRLIVHIFFPARVVYVKFFGTHAAYDKIDAITVDDFGDY